MIDYKKANEKSIEAKKEKQLVLENLCSQNTQLSNYIKLVPRLYRNLLQNVYFGKKSYARAVKAKCLDCACYVKKEVTNCSVETCPLYKLRPYQVKE